MDFPISNAVPKGTRCAISPSLFADDYFQLGNYPRLLPLSNEMAQRYNAESLGSLTAKAAQRQLEGLRDKEATLKRIHAYEAERILSEIENFESRFGQED